MNEGKQNKVVFYESNNGHVELRADTDKDTIWATQEQIGDLFDTERSVVTKHIRNILRDKELVEDSVCANFAHTAGDGKRYKVKYYNLDAVIAVGYRINSKRATRFRIWATRVLHEYLIDGYSLNRYRLDRAPEKLEGLHEAIAFMESDDHPGALNGKVTIKLTKNLKPKANNK